MAEPLLAALAMLCGLLIGALGVWMVLLCEL
jgi:hypothetical protein